MEQIYPVSELIGLNWTASTENNFVRFELSLYSYTCKKCPDINKYTGETSRNLYTRDLEHRDNKNKNSWMHSHQQEKHEGAEPDFKMKVERIYKDPLSRQASEAVFIRRTNGNVLNSKIEFNQPQLYNVRREIMNG